MKSTLPGFFLLLVVVFGSLDCRLAPLTIKNNHFTRFKISQIIGKRFKRIQPASVFFVTKADYRARGIRSTHEEELAIHEVVRVITKMYMMDLCLPRIMKDKKEDKELKKRNMIMKILLKRKRKRKKKRTRKRRCHAMNLQTKP